MKKGARGRKRIFMSLAMVLAAALQVAWTYFQNPKTSDQNTTAAPAAVSAEGAGGDHAKDASRQPCPEARDSASNCSTAAADMKRKPGGGGLSAGFTLIGNYGYLVPTGSISFFSDIHLVGKLFLNVSASLHFFRDRYEEWTYSKDERIFPVWAAIGLEYVWLWRRCYLYPGARLALGFYYYGFRLGEPWEKQDSVINGLVIAGDFLLGFGIRLPGNLSLFMEMKAILGGNPGGVFGHLPVLGSSIAGGIRIGF
jgi:hypothetical protein